MFAAINQIKTREETFERVNDIDEGVNDQAEQQRHVNRAENFARLENSLLKQNCNRGFHQTGRNILQLRRRSSFAYRVDDGFEPMNREPHRNQSQNNEDDLFNQCQQRALQKILNTKDTKVTKV